MHRHQTVVSWLACVFLFSGVIGAQPNPQGATTGSSAGTASPPPAAVATPSANAQTPPPGAAAPPAADVSNKNTQASDVSPNGSAAADGASTPTTDSAALAKFDDLKSAKFIQYGITAGFAFAIQSSSLGDGTKGSRQKSATSTTMPYVLLVPAYWAYRDISRKYCAALYGSDEATALKAANTYAKEVTKIKGSPDQKKAIGNTNPDPTDLKGKHSIEDTAIDGATGWDPTAEGRCGWTRIGAWFGKPIAYDASVVSTNNDPESKQQVDSTFAFGLAYTPNAYVAALIGLSLNRITIPAVAATATQPAIPDQIRRFTNLTVGFGGNLDILGTLFK